MKLVLVEWVDSQITPTWTRDNPPDAALICRTVGWLVHDGSESKTLAGSVTVEADPQRCCQMTIPAAAITRMKLLR